MILTLNYAAYGNKRSRLTKEQETSWLLSSLGTKTPLGQFPFVGPILIYRYKMMYEIINNFLLADDKFVPEMHLRQPGLTYVLVNYLLKIDKEQRKLKKQVIQDIFIKTN